jgi:rfaE bifunctional protein nucleotidyltransferase chain/domain
MHYHAQITNKQYTLQNLLPIVAAWKANGETIVFTNGCFDILHLGHIQYLTQAADLGTRLIVGINTDASVQRLKGTHRPLQNQQSRTQTMAALACVSAVILFDEPTPLQLIQHILPHILTKGADYTISNIVGADVVINNGGQVQTLHLMHGYSTTAIEQKIKNTLNNHLDK